MREISPEDVLAAVLARLGQPRGPLAVEHARVAPADLVAA
jgi:hypothetical protein